MSAAFGYCHLACVPLRRDPDLCSEMISQVLFAEAFEILAVQGHYARVRVAHDGYEGWLDQRQTTTISRHDFEWMQSESSPVFVADLFCAAGVGSRLLTLVRGTPLPGYGAGKFVVPGEIGWLRGAVTRGLAFESAAFLNSLEAYLHAPYLWGGRSPWGLDCSGLVQMAFRPFGFALPRDSEQQRDHGVTVSGGVAQARAGDIAFFASEIDDSSHVGIVLPESQIMHASGFVRVDRLADSGIWHAEEEKRTHRLLEIKRLAELGQNGGKSA